MNPARDILVIDDEAVVVQGVARICASEGISVDTASSGRAGLERLERSAYRLILCDIMMGDIDGFAFLAESRYRGNRTPVIMTTGNSTVQNAVRSLRCGAVDYLPKPFTADELLAVVRRGLRYPEARAGTLGGPADPGRCPAEFHRLGNLTWVAVESVGTVLIGVHEVFVRTLGGIRSVEPAPAGTELVQGGGCATIVSADGLVHGVLCPVSGRVLEANAETTSLSAWIERDPYGAGWLQRLLPSDLRYDLQWLSSGSSRSDEPIPNPQGEPT